MKYIIISILCSLSIGFVACNKKEQKTTNDSNTSIELEIDTISVQNNRIEEELFTDEVWTQEVLHTLRKNKTPYEVIMVSNSYSEVPDSMLTFTDVDFRYSFLKVNHLDKLILEYFEENNLDLRTPLIKDVEEKIQILRDEIKIESEGVYVIHVSTETEMSDLYLGLSDDKVISAKFLGFVD